MPPKTVVVDNETYVQASSLGPIQIVVLERGFIYVGRVAETADGVDIHNARPLRRWGTSTGLGELTTGPRANTKLDAACLVVKARWAQVIHQIGVSQDEWSKHCG